MTGQLPIQLPLGFGDWSPALQATLLGLMTFVQEDLPTVSSALLASAGKLGWQTGFIGCFLGIWVGDMLLYGFARGVGRGLMEKTWARRYFNPVKVQQSEVWFAAKGNWLLLSSRFIPGTRLPTYVAAGFLRLPFAQFLVVTGSAVLAWTIGIFALANIFGPKLLDWLGRFNQSGWIFLALIIAIVILIRLVMTAVQKGFWIRLNATIGRWMRWEFWPAWLFYGPVAAHYLWLAVRHRSFTLPTAANPGIFTGGMVGESKLQTLNDLTRNSAEFTAEAYGIKTGTIEERVKNVLELCRAKNLSFPFILKPDIGQRGVGVKLVRNEEQLTTYFQNATGDTVLQKYVPGPYEVGVFYYRYPNEPHGRIFAITEKVFPYVEGDGRSTLEELIWKDSRARFIAEKYLARMGERRTEILPRGETYKLVEAGNHAQGCIFRDGMRLNSPELEERIDAISKQVDGFFVGRYDIRYSSPEDFKRGTHFSIIELNGASAEVASIYDERNSLWSAYKTLRHQWKVVFEIGAANRRLGNPPMKLMAFLKLWRTSTAQMATLPAAD